MTALPNLGLILPVLGSSDGNWDDLLNDCLELIDAHDHSPGRGLRIKTAAINIDADLTFSGKSLTNLGQLKFAEIAEPVGGATTLYVDSTTHELYWITSGGSHVKLTNGASINTSLVGGIVGDYTAVSAEVAFDDSNKRYTFKDGQSPKVWARLAAGDVRIYEMTSGVTNYVGIKSPTALAASYSIEMPAALPAGAAFAMVGSGGAVTFDEEPVLGANKSITLSGTGYVKHGTRTRRVAFHAGGLVVESGTVSNNSTLPGQQVDASSSAYFYLGPVNALESISSVHLILGNTPANAVTYEFYVASAGSGAASWSLVGSGTTTASNAPTVSPGGLYALGDSAWIKVTTPSATVCKMVLADITYEVP